MVAKRVDITIGDLVRKTNSTNWVWQVAEFVTPTGHKPHARLVRVNNPSDMRIFAIAALKDRRLFEDAGNAKGPIEARIPLQWESRAGA